MGYLCYNKDLSIIENILAILSTVYFRSVSIFCQNNKIIPDLYFHDNEELNKL